ncbi:MAG: methylmalonyl Co-A mutase-associated GTPase MeaB [Halalkalicoccus sp.]|nr:methylmalonyl Co-A mutase-associated GTPase MeaB [Halalkalicoccus sp.]
MSRGGDALVEDLLDGQYRALARTITRIENRSPGYRELVADLHEHTGGAEVIGITGSPGAGKSTLVDKLAKSYREEGLTVGVIAVDPSSPYTGGAVLGDRIRMASTTGDMDTFVRSMSARGQLGGLSTATGDAITAFDAFGIDRVIVETVGAGQNEVDIVRTADTVAVLVQPESGDDIQMLKAGILEIGDVFVVNKADMPGADRTVKQLSEMLEGRYNGEWTPEIVETVATSGEGLSDLLDAFSAHREFLETSGALEEKARTRYAEEVRTLLREDAGRLLEGEIERRGGIEELVDRIVARETDPYTVADEIVAPLEECLTREEAEASPR